MGHLPLPEPKNHIHSRRYVHGVPVFFEGTVHVLKHGIFGSLRERRRAAWKGYLMYPTIRVNANFNTNYAFDSCGFCEWGIDRLHFLE
jgi:hypothetical protein